MILFGPWRPPRTPYVSLRAQTQIMIGMAIGAIVWFAIVAYALVNQ